MKYSKPVIKSVFGNENKVKPLGSCYDTFSCKKYSCTGTWKCNFSFSCKAFSTEK